VVLGLVGLGVLGYAGYVFYVSRKQSELSDEEAAAIDAEMAQADRENGFVTDETEEE
jgi:uncharacterized membrane protein YebE (DUF533 family)